MTEHSCPYCGVPNHIYFEEDGLEMGDAVECQSCQKIFYLTKGNKLRKRKNPCSCFNGMQTEFYGGEPVNQYFCSCPLGQQKAAMQKAALAPREMALWVVRNKSGDGALVLAETREEAIALSGIRFPMKNDVDGPHPIPPAPGVITLLSF